MAQLDHHIHYILGVSRQRIYEEVLREEGFTLQGLADALAPYEPSPSWRPLYGPLGGHFGAETPR